MVQEIKWSRQFPEEMSVPLDAVLAKWLGGERGYEGRQAAWVVVKRELKRMGHWKDRRRGDPAKGMRVREGRLAGGGEVG